MQFGQEFEKVFFKLSIEQPKYLKTIKNGFYESEEIDLLNYLANKFYEKFSETPGKEQMKLLVKNSKKAKEKVSDEIVDKIYSTDIDEYDNDWLKSAAESWIKYRHLDTSLQDTIEYLKTTNVTPDNCDHVISKVKDIINERNNLSFNSDLGLDFFNPDDHYQKESEKISTGYNFLDRLLNGGYDKEGNLVVYAGEQSIGKSIYLANDAASYMKMGVNTAVITAEMEPHKFVKRIGANLLNISVNEYGEKAQDRDFIKRKLETVGDGITPPGQLQVKRFPTSQATVIDIESYLQQLEEEKGIKLGAVVIDYINILANYRNPNTENTYLKIKQIAEDLRAMGQRNGWLIVTATQITRCLSLDTIVNHETKGDIEIRSLETGDKILTNEGYSKVSKIYDKTVQKTYRIKTKSGKSIRASANHIFPVLNKNNEIEHKKLKDIKNGEKIFASQ